MADVHRLDTPWHGPLETEKVIEGARAANLDNVLIIGWKDGDIAAFSDFASKADMIWLIERVKHDLLAGRWG